MSTVVATTVDELVKIVAHARESGGPLDAPSLAKKLVASSEDGVSTESVAGRRDRFGSNEFPPRKGKSFWSILKERAVDQTILILAAAAVISLALGIAFPSTTFYSDCNCVVTDTTGWVEGVAILVAVLVIVAVGSLVDYDKEKRFTVRDLADVRHATVMRSGEALQVVLSDVVVGDVVMLTGGNLVPQMDSSSLQATWL
jgi:Ca2+-transporting ATPase